MNSFLTIRDLSNRERLNLSKITTIKEEHGPASGSIVHIFGEYNSGKTILTTNISREASLQKYTTIYFPAKPTIPYYYIYDISRFFIVKTENIEGIFETMSTLMDKHNKYLFIIDDMSLMKSVIETSLEESILSKYLDRFSSLLRQVTQQISITNSILLIVSQIRTQISTSRQVAHLRYINDISDIIYEVAIAERQKGKKTIGIKILDKIAGAKDISYFTIGEQEENI